MRKMKITVVALAALLTVSSCGTSQGTGTGIGAGAGAVLGGLIGILRYVLPIGSFVLAIKIACIDEEEDYITRRLVQYSVLLICIKPTPYLLA